MKNLLWGCAGILGALFALVVLLVVLSAIFGWGKTGEQQSASSRLQSPSAASAPQATATPLPGIGERVVSKNFAFTITDARKGAELGNFSKKKAQGIFVVLTVKIENLTNQSQPINTWDTKLLDAEGRKYDISNEGSSSLLGTEPEPFWLSATIQPGLSKTVRLVFDVNPNTQGLGLEVQGGKLIAIR